MTSKLDQLLASLSDRFCSELPRKLALLREYLEAAKQDPKVLKMLTTLAHQLAGSAGTFGYNELGLVARDVATKGRLFSKIKQEFTIEEYEHLSFLLYKMDELASFSS